YNRPVAVQIPRAGQPLDKTPAETIIADDRYIHDSIVLPEKEVAAGYRPIMPTFQGRLSEEDILNLIAYIRSLGTGNGTANGGSKGTSREDYGGPITPEDIQVRTGFTPKNIGDIT